MSLGNLKALPATGRKRRVFLALTSLPSWLQILTALVIVILATFALIALQHFVAYYDQTKHGPAFVAFYFIAIAIATLVGGKRTGLIAVLFSVFCTAYFLIPPLGKSFAPTMANYVTLLIVVVVGSFVALGMDAYRSNTFLLVQNTDLLAVEQARANQEAVINRIGQAVRTAEDPYQIQRIAVTALGEVLNVDRCYFLKYDPARDTVAIGTYWGQDGEAGSEQEFTLTELGLKLDSLYKHGETVVIDDVRTNSLSNQAVEKLEQYEIRSAILVPLSARGKLDSTLVVSMAKNPRVWRREEISLIEAVAVQTRLAIDAARIQQKEHNIAMQLQAALQPDVTIDVEGLNIASFYRAALEEANVGGDFFDAFALPNGHTAFVVGDVSGKGLAAASQVAAIRHMLRCLLQTVPGLVDAIQQLNSVLIEQNLLPAFATLFVAVLDPATLELEYVSCGHEPGLIHRTGESNEVLQLPSTGPVIGVFDPRFGNEIAGLFGSAKQKLLPGDVVLLYTDGVCDAGQDVTKLLGVDGVVTLLRSYYSEIHDINLEQSASDLLAYCVRETEKFANGFLRDDICLLAVAVSSRYQLNEAQESAPLQPIESDCGDWYGGGNSFTDELRRTMLADALRLATHGKLRIVIDPHNLPTYLDFQAEKVQLDIGENVRTFRRSVRRAAEEAGLAPEFADSLEMAAGEAANNSLVHAHSGVGHVSWNSEGSVQVRVEDTGGGIPYEDLPRATLERGYTTAGTLGQGFWIILQSVKRCWISTGPNGTVVVLEQNNEGSAAESLPVSLLI